MTLFDTHIVVDWSARSTPSPAKPTPDAIWWAAARDGVASSPAYVRTGHAPIRRLAKLIATERAARRRVLVGFDFPFGHPSDVARHLTGRARAFDLWGWLATRIQEDEHNANNRYVVAAEINRRYPGVGPSWGRPATWSYPDVPTGTPARTHRTTQPPKRRIADEHAKGAKTVWQLAYTGSVGSQVLLGLPALQRLRSTPSIARSVSVWPFDGGLGIPDNPVVFAECIRRCLTTSSLATRRNPRSMTARRSG